MTSRVLSRAENLLKLAGAAGVGPILGLDTGGEAASLAIAAGSAITAELSRPAASHCAGLPEAADELLAAAGLTFNDIAGIAVALGPGSFTGLRVGLSYAKGLVMALGCPIVGVPSLDAMALYALESGRASSGGLVCPLIDARRGDLYAALYRVVPDGVEKLTEDLITRFEGLVPEFAGEVTIVGRPKADENSLFPISGGVDVTFIDPPVSESPGRLVAAIGSARIASGKADGAAGLQPIYVQRAAAVALTERNRA